MNKNLRKLIDGIIFNISKKWHNKMILKRAVNDAKSKWLQSGKQQFVLYTDNKYMVINKAFIDNLNKTRKPKITHRQLMDISVYVTPVSCYINI